MDQEYIVPVKVWAYDGDIDKFYHDKIDNQGHYNAKIYTNDPSKLSYTTWGEIPKNTIEIVIPDGIVEIDNIVDDNYTFLRRVVFPNSLRIIGDCSFQSSINLEDAVLPEGVERTGFCSFCYCYKLRSPKFPKSLKEIGKASYEDCYNITYIVIPPNVKSVGDMAFNHDKNARVIIIHEGVIYIGYYAFSDSKIKSVTIPSSVETLGNSAFSGCDELICARFRRGCKIKRLNGTFQYCDKLTDIILHEGLEVLAYNFCNKCTSLERIVIPKSVKEICMFAFTDCPNLKDVTLSKDCKIHPMAFDNGGAGINFHYYD